MTRNNSDALQPQDMTNYPKALGIPVWIGISRLSYVALDVLHFVGWRSGIRHWSNMRCECDTCFGSLRFSIMTLLQRISQSHGLAVVWPYCTLREVAAAPAASNPSQGTCNIVVADDIMFQALEVVAAYDRPRQDR
jgi:hypothetical protein